MKCSKCGTSLAIQDGRWVCPRCDFWKGSYSERLWRKHADNVEELLDSLELRFPQMTWTTGLGAMSGQRLDIPPASKNEADIEGWWMRRCVVAIEVSGTDSTKVNVPPDDVLIRPGKIRAAQESAAAHYFYMVYREAKLVVPLAVAEQYRRAVSGVEIRGKVETYIRIPCDAALPGDRIFELVSVDMTKAFEVTG